MLDPYGNEQFVVNGQADLSESAGLEMPEVNTIIQLRDVSFTAPGRYMFVVMVDKDYKDQLLLQVNQVQQT